MSPQLSSINSPSTLEGHAPIGLKSSLAAESLKKKSMFSFQICTSDISVLRMCLRNRLA